MSAPCETCGGPMPCTSSWCVACAKADAKLGARLNGSTREKPDPGKLFANLYDFVGRFVAYPSEHARVAHVLWVGHTHCMGAWESTPRLAALSPEPASGKTRLLEITALLVPDPVEAINMTPAYLFRRVGNNEDGLPTILHDEIDTVFGPKAKENEDIRGLLNAGHRRGAKVGRCVVRGRAIEPEDTEAFCAVALAGLGWLPDTLMSRSIVIRMRRRHQGERVEPYRHRLHSHEGHRLRDALATWAAVVVDELAKTYPEMPEGVEDRDADVWESLLAVAELHRWGVAKEGARGCCFACFGRQGGRAKLGYSTADRLQDRVPYRLDANGYTIEGAARPERVPLE